MGYNLLDIYTISGGELAEPAKTVDVVAEGKTHLTYIGIGEEIRQLLRHAYMREAEEIASFMIRYLHERRRVMDSPLERRSGLRVHTYHFLLAQVVHRRRHVLLVLDDNNLAFKDLHGVML